MMLSDLYHAGEQLAIGTHTFSEEEIMVFARRFDPQRFHIDRQAASESMFGSLCASGWHTCAVWMGTFVRYWATEQRRLVMNGITPPKLGASPGIENLKWIRPVFPNERITFLVAYVSSRPLASRPGEVLNTILASAEDESGKQVMSFEGKMIEFV